MEGATTSHIIHDQGENGVNGKAVKKSGKRIGYNYIILKSLKESQKNDVVKCLYIKSLTDFGICVIKEGTYGDSKDKDGRDIKDKLLWQKQLHQQLQDKVRLPRLLGSFEESGNYYLVLECIKGKSLYKVITENNAELRQGLLTGTRKGLKFLDCLVQLVTLLETLHKNQVVHRDVSAANFMITPKGKVAIIDMELSYSLQLQLPSPPFQLGTYGYMSPEQESMQPPAVAQDIYSVGAILLQVWTGISPTKLTNTPIEELYDKVQFFVPDKPFADIILQLLQPESIKRPSLQEVRQMILQYKDDLQRKRRRPVFKTAVFQQDQITATIQQVIGALASPLFADEEKGWFSEDVHAEKNADKRKINRSWFTSFHKGASGVLYMLSQAHRLGFNTSTVLPQIQHSIALVEEKYMSRIEQVSPSLHFGSSGIAACLAIAIKEGLIEPKTMYFDWIDRLLKVENPRLNIMNGIAGQGMALWNCQPFLSEVDSDKRISGYFDSIVNNQEKDGSWVNEIVDGKKRVTRGFANGVAGLIYFLLEYARRYKSKEALMSAQHGLSFLMKKAIWKNGVVRWRSTRGKEISPWWYEGGPGIALAFIKAYSLTGDHVYQEYGRGALYAHSPTVINNNLSQCEGLSGLGEIYLDAYRIFKDQEWLDRAGWIAQVIMQLKKENSVYGPYWLVEHERQPVADFMIGNSGIIHFLLRYCYPEKISFPLIGSE
jgi:serine/threonine protein kinase